MHFAFLAPEYPSDQILFVRALKRLGARVSGIGSIDRRYLPRDLRRLLDDYEKVGSVEKGRDVARGAKAIDRRHGLDRIEAVHEKQVLAASEARGELGLNGTRLEVIRLCRDKLAMKELLRSHGVACADCRGVEGEIEAMEHAEDLGFPLVLKPRQGYGGLETYLVESQEELAGRLRQFESAPRRALVMESLVEGREGFYDTLTIDGRVAHEFLAYYQPGVLAALSRPEEAARVWSDNRVESESCEKIRTLGTRVIEILELDSLATHMEFFESEEGLVFSEIGARPPGERLWELHAIGNDLDLHLEWASGILRGKKAYMASRRFAVGSVQVRPRRQGRIAGYRGLARLHRELGKWIVSSQVLTRGYPTTPLSAGYLGNAWFRLFHPDVEVLCGMLDRFGDELEILVE